MSFGITALVESNPCCPASKGSTTHHSSMGNATSSTTSSGLGKRRSVFPSKPSGIVSQLHLTCTNVDSTMERIDSPTQETSALIVSEKFRPSQDRKSQDRKSDRRDSQVVTPTAATFRSSLILANPPELPFDDATKAYHAFLHDSPGTVVSISRCLN